MYIDQDRKTALYWAVEKGHPDIVQLLLDNDANVEISTKVRLRLHISLRSFCLHVSGLSPVNSPYTFKWFLRNFVTCSHQQFKLPHRGKMETLWPE